MDKCKVTHSHVLYHVGTLSLIRSAKGRDQLQQVWYADNA